MIHVYAYIMPNSQLIVVDNFDDNVQGFNWESCNKAGGWYNSLTNFIPDIANAGVTHVWLPPPSQSVGPQGYAPSITKIYMERTSPDFAVGEKWEDLSLGQDSQDSHRGALKVWVEAAGGAVKAFDFTTKGVLNAAVQGELWRLKDSNGKSPRMIRILPQNAVTFIDNHDTGSTQRLWPFPSDKVMQGYAYILTHPGTPSIFYDHFVDWGLKDEITKLSAVRRNNGISETSKVNIVASDSDLYVAVIDEKIITKIGPKMDLGNLVPSNYQLATSGKDYAVWVKK
ncbi:Alpha-amylase 1 [Hibiscus syriacus]|uniref:alpha-amylase n=1 Tax=Hibiscus syriacus TaxID=106335 RepID=A0A6A2XAG6_HIBSY|nr:Alpha-amylase 1 [Hibiscus syriacus]